MNAICQSAGCRITSITSLDKCSNGFLRLGTQKTYNTGIRGWKKIGKSTMACSNFYMLITQFSFHPRISGIRTHPASAGVRPSITIILGYYSIRLFRHPGNPHETRLPEKRSLHFIEILLYFIEISLHFVEI